MADGRDFVMDHGRYGNGRGRFGLIDSAFSEPSVVPVSNQQSRLLIDSGQVAGVNCEDCSGREAVVRFVPILRIIHRVRIPRTIDRRAPFQITRSEGEGRSILILRSRFGLPCRIEPDVATLTAANLAMTGIRDRKCLTET
mgnify:CR=1 FL=1